MHRGRRLPRRHPQTRRRLNGTPGLGGRGRGAPKTLDEGDRGAQQVEVGRLAWPRVVLQPDPDVPAAADGQLGQPAPHHVAAEHRHRPRQAGRLQQLQVGLQGGRGRPQPELQLAAEVQLDHRPRREPAAALPGQSGPQEPRLKDRDTGRGPQLAAASEHVLDVGERVGVGPVRGVRGDGAGAGQPEVHRPGVHQGHAAHPPAGQLCHVRPPLCHRDSPRSRGHRRVQQRVRVAFQHRSPRRQVRLDGVHPVGGEHRLVVVVVHDRGARLDARQGGLGDLGGRAGHVSVAVTGGCAVHRQLQYHRLGHRWLV